MKINDHNDRPIVVVSGVGLTTPLAKGVEENWKKLCGGESGIKDIKRFNTKGLKTTIAGIVEEKNPEDYCAAHHTYQLAHDAAQEAIMGANINVGEFNGPLFLAIPPVEMEWSQKLKLYRQNKESENIGYRRMIESAQNGDYKENMFRTSQFGYLAETLAQKFGTVGLPISLTTACASGATAIQMGVEAIRRGECNRALCLGSDGCVSAETVIRFSLLSALSTQNDPAHKASKPFSKGRDGFVMAEGGGALVLESLETAKERGANILAIVRGCGEKADDFHRTRSSPDAMPATTAMQICINDANMKNNEVEYINAHGTSTPENDKMEYLALQQVFQNNLDKIPVSSNKSMIGHTLSAAGAIEAVFSILTIVNGTIPPTINYDNPDDDIQLDVVPNNARKTNVKNVLSNSFGFGGQNACLMFGEYQ